MKKIYNTPEIKKVSFETSDIITSSLGMTVGTFVDDLASKIYGGMSLGGSDFGDFNETGF